MPFDPHRPYNDLPDLPPAVELESRLVLKACIEARAALAELKSVAAALPNPTVLINSIPLLEAQASTEIENIVTTSDALFRYVQDERGSDPATKEALNYRAALREGFESLAHRPAGERQHGGAGLFASEGLRDGHSSHSWHRALQRGDGRADLHTAGG